MLRGVPCHDYFAINYFMTSNSSELKKMFHCKCIIQADDLSVVSPNVSTRGCRVQSAQSFYSAHVNVDGNFKLRCIELWNSLHASLLFCWCISNIHSNDTSSLLICRKWWVNFSKCYCPCDLACLHHWGTACSVSTCYIIWKDNKLHQGG